MAALTDFVKVYFLDANGRIAYCPAVKVWSEFKESLEAILPEVNLRDCRVYWVDDEDDQVDIFDNLSLKVFWMALEAKKKVYVERKQAEVPVVSFVPTTEEQPSTGRASKPNAQGLVPHPNVICDGCDKGIFGFRYKCIQCSNFDLCLACEGKMLHKEHVMFRLPEPLNRFQIERKTLKLMKRGKFGSCEQEREYERRHSHSHSRKSKKQRPSCTVALRVNDGDGEETEIPIELEISAQETKNESSSEECRKKNGKTDQSSASATAPQNFENLLRQPANYINAGMEILNMFNQMFTNMSAPANTTASAPPTPPCFNSDAAGTPPSDSKESSLEAECSQPKSVASEQQKQQKFEQNVKGAVPKESTSQTSVAVETAEEATATISNKNIVDENQTRKSPPVETEWTLIDQQNDEMREQPKQKPKSTESSLSETDYVKLSKDLKKHMENEVKSRNPKETRAKIVYHQKEHINEAVMQMIAMGFCNDGKYLARLLETVDGDIGAALEILQTSSN